MRTVAGINAANEFLIDEARDGAPVKSGDLRNGIEVISEATDSDPVAVGAAKEPYSAIINRGTAENDAQPFWTSGWIRMKTGFDRFFK